MIIGKNLPPLKEPRLYMSLERTYLTYLKFSLLAFGSGILAKRLEIIFLIANKIKIALLLAELYAILVYPSIISLLVIAIKFFLDIKYIEGGEAVSQKEIIDPRIYMAAERTFLAWIRTAIGLIAFGFVVEKFGFFLKQINIMFHININTEATKGFNEMGITFMILGIITLLIGGFNFYKTIEQVNKGTYKTHTTIYSIYGISIFIACAFLASMIIKV